MICGQPALEQPFWQLWASSGAVQHPEKTPNSMTFRFVGPHRSVCDNSKSVTPQGYATLDDLKGLQRPLQ